MEARKIEMPETQLFKVLRDLEIPIGCLDRVVRATDGFIEENSDNALEAYQILRDCIVDWELLSRLLRARQVLTLFGDYNAIERETEMPSWEWTSRKPPIEVRVRPERGPTKKDDA